MTKEKKTLYIFSGIIIFLWLGTYMGYLFERSRKLKEISSRIMEYEPQVVPIEKKLPIIKKR